MSEQVQHSLLNMGNEELKTLLIGEIGESYTNCDGNILYPKTEFKEHEEILNKELRIHLVANITAKTMYYRHSAYAVVTVDLHHGARTWYFKFDGTKLAKRDVTTDIFLQAESARHILQQKYYSIVQEEWNRKEEVLSSIIGPRRALKLERPKRFIDNFYIDRYAGLPTTTVAEREQLKKLGLAIGLLQE
jgi:hypothetical protein